MMFPRGFGHNAHASGATGEARGYIWDFDRTSRGAGVDSIASWSMWCAEVGWVALQGCAVSLLSAPSRHREIESLSEHRRHSRRSPPRA